MDNKILYTVKFMILNSTKFGGNRTKDVDVGLDRQTDSYIHPPPTMFAGGIIIHLVVIVSSQW